MLRFRIDKKTTDGVDVFHLHGTMMAGIAEPLRKATLGAGKRARFDWGGVTVTNSVGLREWVYFLEEFAEGRSVEYASCPASAVTVFNMLPRVLGEARVLSMYGTFVCTRCQREQSVLMDLTKDLTKDLRLAVTPTCKTCDGDLRLTPPEPEYFGFLAP